MGRDVHSSGAAEKERIRAEIESQVQQFLQKGGHIDVLAHCGTRKEGHPGSVWEDLDDEIGLSGGAGIS
jgi:hypothetical protein